MNNQNLLKILLVIFLILIGVIKISNKPVVNINQQTQAEITNPLMISEMRKKQYPGSDLVIEEKLSSNNNYTQYLASYLSDGLKIFGLLTIPVGQKPQNGWPVIIFNHGYLTPQTYTTTGRYIAHVDGFARNGYIVFKPDYRGHGNSQGTPEGAYYSPGYATDVLNAVATLKKYKDANPDKLGMWGHSMGGNITLRDIMVDTKDIKAAVIWGGVVGSYDDLMNNWQRKVTYQPSAEDLRLRNNNRQKFIKDFGTPQSNPSFWNSIDPTAHLTDINTPIQLHTGGSDEEVPTAFSQQLFDKLKALGKTVEYYNYPGGDHNISSPNFNLAMKRSISFFDKYLKN